MTNRLLLDVSSLIYRAHFAMRDLIHAPEGRPVGAVHGYLDMVHRLLVVTRHPDEVVHVYDHDWRPTARTSIYPGYKSERPPEPDGLPGAVRDAAPGPRPHRYAAGPDAVVGGRGRDRSPRERAARRIVSTWCRVTATCSSSCATTLRPSACCSPCAA